MNDTKSCNKNWVLKILDNVKAHPVFTIVGLALATVTTVATLSTSIKEIVSIIPDDKCHGFEKFEMELWKKGARNSWHYTTNLKDKTTKGTHPGGGITFGDIEYSCENNYLVFTITNQINDTSLTCRSESSIGANGAVNGTCQQSERDSVHYFEGNLFNDT